MRELLADMHAGAAVVHRDLRIVLSYPTRFITHLLSLCFTLTLFHFLSRLVRVAAFPTPEAYYAFAVVGLISLQVLNSTLSAPPGGLRQELVAGTFERFVLSPFGPVRSIVSSMLFPLLYALVSALAMLIFAGAVFGLPLSWSTVPLVVPVGLLGALSFAPFGLLLLAGTMLSRQALPGANFLIAGISLIAGLYFPVSLLPDWMQWLSTVQPFTPAVDLLRHVMVVDSPLHDELWIELAKLVAFTAVLLPLSIRALSATVQISRRRGTMLEY
jgi:ABC-2 type transport system permease protein